MRFFSDNAAAAHPAVLEAIAAAAGGTARVTADYDYELDGADQADTFLIYLRSDGTDPDPDADVAIEVAMEKVDGRAHLDWSS